MSYNTRRSGNFGAGTQNQQASIGNIGQRRPATNNFVSGGQLNPQSKPGVQMANQQQRVPQAQVQNTNTNANFRAQPNQGYQTQQQQPIKTETVSPKKTYQPPQQQQQLKAEVASPKTIIPGVNPPNPALENVNNGDPMETSNEEIPKKKPFWAKGGSKISKKEKLRRRNLRLSKVLQPKNAVMILNELVKNTSYMVDEIPVKTDANQFQAAVLVEGVEHVGLGRSKIHAKNEAAEIALKHLVKSNKLTEMKKDEEGNEKMDVSDDETQPPLPWQHVASFALYKLFSSWGEDPNIVNSSKVSGMEQTQIQLNDSGTSEKTHENKPAKKLPANPETMNPLMLLNQMLPHAQFEEIGKSGNPPNVTYSYRCNVDGQSFIGTGPNKKAAKKLAAFGACHKLLNITYSPEVYVPIF